MSVTAHFLTEIVDIACPREDARSSEPGLWRRFVIALHESRARQADRELARHAHLNGLLADSVERRMSEAMIRSGRPAR